MRFLRCANRSRRWTNRRLRCDGRPRGHAKIAMRALLAYSLTRLLAYSLPNSNERSHPHSLGLDHRLTLRLARCVARCAAHIARAGAPGRPQRCPQRRCDRHLRGRPRPRGGHAGDRARGSRCGAADQGSQRDACEGLYRRQGGDWRCRVQRRLQHLPALR